MGKDLETHTFVDENTGAVEMDINPANPNELYAASWHRIRKGWDFTEGGKTSGIHKSNDGGETWQLLTTEGSGFPQGDGIGRIGVAVYPNNPSIVYAIVDNYNLKSDTFKIEVGPTATQIFGCEVYKSINGGKNWIKTHEKPIGIYNTFGYYFGKIFISPVNPEKL